VAYFKALPQYLLGRIPKNYEKTQIGIAGHGLRVEKSTFRITSQNVANSIATLKHIQAYTMFACE
jgi:hypothetical protein